MARRSVSLRVRVIAAAVTVAIAPVLLVGLFGFFERDLASDMRVHLETATLETGVVIQVPLFINVGDVLKVDPRDGRYISRA